MKESGYQSLIRKNRVGGKEHVYFHETQYQSLIGKNRDISEKIEELQNEVSIPYREK